MPFLPRLRTRLRPQSARAQTVNSATYFVGLTTPYVLLGLGESEWLAYFERFQIVPGTVGGEERLRRHMKLGGAPTYWSEFIFYGYVNFRSDAIFLTGLPDRPETQPHRQEFNPRTWRLG